MSMIPKLLAAAMLAALAPATYAQSPAPAPRGEGDPRVVEREVRRIQVEDERIERELRVAERELERASARVAVLAQRLAADDVEHAFRHSLFARPVIGVVLAPDPEAGVRVAAVTPQSPAAKAGLRGGDRLTTIDGRAIDAADPESRLAQARELIGELEDGEKLRLGYQRDGKSQQVELAAETRTGLAWIGHDGEALRIQALAPLPGREFQFHIGEIAPFAACGDNPDACARGLLGQALRWRQLRLAEVDPQLGRYFGTDRGVLVLKAAGEELAALQPGDVILAVAGEAVDSPAEAMRALQRAEPGATVPVALLRDRKRLEVDVTAPEPRVTQLFAVPAPPAPPAPPQPPAPPAPARKDAPPPAPEPPPASPPSGVLDSVLI